MLTQLIGPPDCGKTSIREALCPGAVRINGYDNFNAYMYDAPGYFFEEVSCLDRRFILKLEEWMSSEYIRIERMGKTPLFYKNPGIWIYEGLRALSVPFETKIWRVAKCVGLATKVGTWLNKQIATPRLSENHTWIQDDEGEVYIRYSPYHRRIDLANFNILQQRQGIGRAIIDIACATNVETVRVENVLNLSWLEWLIGYEYPGRMTVCLGETTKSVDYRLTEG